VLPLAAPIVIAPDERHRDVEGVGQEPEIGRLEVSAADDPVEPAERGPIHLVIERRIDVVGDGQQPDRPAVAPDERLRVGPHDGEPAGHPSLSSASGFIDSSWLIDADGR
jgi:hypothetical protein